MRQFYNDNADLEGTLNVSFSEDVQNAPLETARVRLANATESDADRRTTAVMAHAQLKGVVEGVCPPSDVAADLEMVDPLRLETLGVAPADAVRLYRALYKYARVSVESLGAAREALREMGGGRDDSDARRELLGHLWRLYAAAWEGAAGESFPSRVVEAKQLAPSLQDAQEAVETLAADLEEHKRSLARVEEEAAQAQVEAEASFADAAARGDALALELDSTKQALAAVHDELAAAKAAGGDTAAKLQAEAAAAAERFAAELAAAEAKAKADLAGPTKALEDAIIERDAALAGERDAKKVTAVLKADVAFLREKRGGAMDELEVALLRAREAEDRQSVAVRAAKEAKAAAAASEARAVVAEGDAAGLREVVAALRKDVGEKREELESLRAKLDALESEDVRHQLRLARGRYADAENELGEARTQRREAVERSKQLGLDMEAADKERRAALRAQKKAETQMLELQEEVAKLNGEKEALETELEATKATVASLELRVAELEEAIAAAEKEVKRLTGALEKETALKELAEAKTRSLRERVLEMTATLEAKSAPAAASLERLSAAAETGLDAVDEKFASLEAEIASFCEEKGALLGSTEKALDEWTREIARVSQAAMDKANGAVAMLVSTIKTLKETEAQLSAAEEELDIAKTDLGKTTSELQATTQELLKAKANLEESRERTLALETSTAEMSSRLEATLATLATTTRDRDSERSGRLQANLAKAAFRMLKNKFHADAENAADALVDAEEALEAAKTSRAVAHVNAAQAKIRLALLRNGKLAGKPPLAATSPEGGAPPPFVSDAKIMEGTPEDLVPYQTMLAKEYHAASVALKTGPPAAE